MDARTTWPALLSALIRGDSLTADESEWAMNEIMEGIATPSQIAGFGIALRIKGTSVAEMTGLARSMLAHATPISLPGQLTDLVGTGGDGARTVNVSTMGTIVAAAAGTRMIKHGNRAASSACGAADVLEALGVVIDLPPAATAALAAEVGVAFLFAPLYHPALRYAGPTRSELGVPTVFNFLGPVANPARPTAQAVGVFDPRMGEILAGVLAGRGCSALVFHGQDGLDELTTTGPSTLWVVHDGQVAQTEFSPSSLGLPPAATAELAAEVGVAFLFAPLYHPALRYAGPTRSELGVPTVCNFLGPVANPARPTAQAVGVFDPRMGEIIAGVLAGRGCSALVFRGEDGLDELTTTGPSTMWVVHDGQVAETAFDPSSLGLPLASLADLRGGDAAHTAAVARAVLAGERGPVRDVVLLNAAAALAATAGVAGPEAVVPALADGYARATEAVDSGAASALLGRWIEVSRRLAPPLPSR